MMTQQLLLGTRKGLVILEQQGNEWRICRESFAGIPVSYAVVDCADWHAFWTALDHGHWGGKMHRSNDLGENFEEISSPKYPEGTLRSDGEPAATSYTWIIQPGGDDQPNRLYVGTEPGALFQSDDGGETFELVEGLWNHPSREKHWFGGGRDHPGCCSVVVDPRDSNHIYAGISVGGVYESIDGGKTWEGRNKGLIADYLPNPHAEYGHDPAFHDCESIEP